MVPEAVPPSSRLVLLLRSGFFLEPVVYVGVSSVCFSCVFLRDVVTLWVKSVFVTLDRERRITLVVLPFCGYRPLLGSVRRRLTSSFGLSALLVAGGRALIWLVTGLCQWAVFSWPLMLLSFESSVVCRAGLWLYARRWFGHGFSLLSLLSFALQRALVGLVPVGSLLPSGSQPSRWGHPAGSRLVLLDRIEGLAWFSFPLGCFLMFPLSSVSGHLLRQVCWSVPTCPPAPVVSASPCRCSRVPVSPRCGRISSVLLGSLQCSSLSIAMVPCLSS